MRRGHKEEKNGTQMTKKSERGKSVNHNNRSKRHKKGSKAKPMIYYYMVSTDKYHLLPLIVLNDLS